MADEEKTIYYLYRLVDGRYITYVADGTAIDDTVYGSTTAIPPQFNAAVEFPYWNTETGAWCKK